MRVKSKPSLQRLKQLYDYHPESGLFIHKRDSARGRLNGVAGTFRRDGYINISVDGTAYLAHRLAWYYVHNEWVPELDHKNTIRYDNRIKNLRPAKRSQNNGNSNGWRQSKRKYKLPRGVYHYPQCPGAYRAHIVVNKKQVHLGCFSTIEAAASAYRKAAKEHFGEFTKSRRRDRCLLIHR